MTDFEKRQILERWKNNGSIEIGRVFVLAEMARLNIVPDGTFSDDECNIWSAIRRVAD